MVRWQQNKIYQKLFISQEYWQTFSILSMKFFFFFYNINKINKRTCGEYFFIFFLQIFSIFLSKNKNVRWIIKSWTTNFFLFHICNKIWPGCHGNTALTKSISFFKLKKYFFICVFVGYVYRIHFATRVITYSYTCI